MGEQEAPLIEGDEVQVIFADGVAWAGEIAGNIRALFYRFEMASGILVRRPILELVRPAATWVPMPELVRQFHQRVGQTRH